MFGALFFQENNMFMKNSVKFLLFVFTVSLVFACSGKKDQAPANNDSYQDPREDASMQRTMTDTLAVLYNVKKYLSFLKENQVDSAISMLYESVNDSVVPISEHRKSEILQQLKSFPVLDYQIDMVRMFSEYDCEVNYTIKYFEKDPNNPMQNTLQCQIKPVRYGYYWYLTIPEIASQPPMEAE